MNALVYIRWESCYTTAIPRDTLPLDMLTPQIRHYELVKTITDVVPHPVTVKDTSSQSSFLLRLTGATRPLVKLKGVFNFNKHTSLLVLEAE